MQLDDFADLLLDRVQRIERRHRLLEDDRNPAARGWRASWASLAFRMSLPSNRISPVGCEAEFGKSRRIDMAETVLPDPEFADERNGLALADRERHALDDASGVVALAERDGKIADIDEASACRPSALTLPEGLARIERVAHRFTHEDRERQDDRHGNETRNAEPRRFEMLFAFEQKFAERRRSRRHAEPKEVEGGQAPRCRPRA